MGIKDLVLNDRAEFTMNCCVTNVKVRESLTLVHASSNGSLLIGSNVLNPSPSIKDVDVIQRLLLSLISSRLLPPLLDVSKCPDIGCVIVEGLVLFLVCHLPHVLDICLVLQEIFNSISVHERLLHCLFLHILFIFLTSLLCLLANVIELEGGKFRFFDPNQLQPTATR